MAYSISLMLITIARDLDVGTRIFSLTKRYSVSMQWKCTHLCRRLLQPLEKLIPLPMSKTRCRISRWSSSRRRDGYLRLLFGLKFRECPLFTRESAVRRALQRREQDAVTSLARAEAVKVYPIDSLLGNRCQTSTSAACAARPWGMPYPGVTAFRASLRE